MTALWAAISVALLIVWVFTVADIIRRRLERGRTIAWILIVMLLPFAGAVLYWVLRSREGVGADGG